MTELDTKGLWENPKVVEAFWEQVDKDGPVPDIRPDLGPCWLWTGKQFTNGYGRLNTLSQSLGTHRLSWEIDHQQTMEKGLLPDHLCMVKLCVNPGHLDACTHAENVRRWAEQAVTSCPQGHPYTEANTIFDGQWRRCRKCRTDYEVTRRVRKDRIKLSPMSGRLPNMSSKLGWLVAHSGFGMYEVGAMSGVSYTHMSEYVNQKHPIRPHHLVGLCDFFDVEPEDLVGSSGLDKKGNLLV